VKDLLFTMPDLSSLSQAITQAVRYDNKILNIDKKGIGNQHL
jgi:hypothetical protein